MLQPRRHAVWSDSLPTSTNDATSFPLKRASGLSKTPGPSKKPQMGLGGTVGKGKVAMTTGLRGKGRVMSKENTVGFKEQQKEGKGKGKGLEEIEPQRLFKEVLLPPQTARRNALLLDKTNTSKKPSSSSLAFASPAPIGTNLKSSLQQAKTPGVGAGIKKTVRLAPQTPAAGLGKGKGKEQDEDEAFRTPAPGKRAKRPPMLEPPTPLFSEGEVETQGKEAEGALWEGGEVPDVEYGPPTAIEEAPIETCDEVIDLEATKELFQIDGPVLVSTWEGSVVDAILAEEKDTVWEVEDSPAVLAEEEGEDYESYIIPDPLPLRRAPAPSTTLRPTARPPLGVSRPRAPLTTTSKPLIRSIRAPLPKSSLKSSLSKSTASAPAPAPTAAQQRRKAAQQAIKEDVDAFRKGGYMEAVGEVGELRDELDGFKLEL